MRVHKVVSGLMLLLAAGSVSAACQFGRSYGRHERSLQSVFDTLLGAHQLSAQNDCLAADATWATHSGDAVATIIVELAGFAPKNEFGIYDALNPSDRIRLFAGRDSAGATSTVQFSGNGDGFDVSVNGRSKGEVGPQFGFYLAAPDHKVYFSDPQLNYNHEDHMVAYQGNGSTFLKGPLAGTSFAAGMYLLGFEDLPLRHSDRDYQDFVALVNYIAPVPLPASIALLGATLLLGLFSRSSARSKPLDVVG